MVACDNHVMYRNYVVLAKIAAGNRPYVWFC